MRGGAPSPAGEACGCRSPNTKGKLLRGLKQLQTIFPFWKDSSGHAGNGGVRRVGEHCRVQVGPREPR